ncbi:MAG: lipid-binding SYLF domain-containing protein [Pseudomonadota bacterium]
MLRALIFAISVLSLGFPDAAFAQRWDPRKDASTGTSRTLTDKSRDTMADFLERDASLQAFFDNAYGLVVFPSVGKGGVGLGYARGSGLVYRNGAPTARAFLRQYSVGFQLGGRSYSEIIFFRDQAEYDNFIRGDFTFRADAAAIISTDGAGAASGYSDGVAVFTYERAGAMVDASIGGQRFSTRDLE